MAFKIHEITEMTISLTLFVQCNGRLYLSIHICIYMLSELNAINSLYR